MQRECNHARVTAGFRLAWDNTACAEVTQGSHAIEGAGRAMES